MDVVGSRRQTKIYILGLLRFGPIFKAFVVTEVQISTVKLHDGSVWYFPVLGHRGSVTKFLGAFVKLRKTSVSFTMSVRPSVWNLSAPTGRIFMKFDI